MNIGEFRHRIKVLKEEIVEDEIGNQWLESVEIADLWAKVSNLHGTEYFAAASIQLEKMLVFTTRYKEWLDETMCILFQGKNYDIKFVDNIKYRNKYLEIRALLSDLPDT